MIFFLDLYTQVMDHMYFYVMFGPLCIGWKYAREINLICRQVSFLKYMQNFSRRKETIVSINVVVTYYLYFVDKFAIDSVLLCT